MFSGKGNPVESRCNELPADYSWTINNETHKQNNIQIHGMDNASFNTIADIWIGDEFVSDWVVTKPLAGPITMDNICHVDKWWTLDDGKYMTPEGNFVEIDDDNHGFEQKLILQGLVAAGAEKWHPDVLDYMGEFANLAGALRLFSKDNNVTAYKTAVKESFSAPTVSASAPTTDAQFLMLANAWAPAIEEFFAGVVPTKSLEEKTIVRALDKLGKGRDKQMATILKAAWFIREAAAIQSSLNITNEQITTAESYKDKSQKLIESMIGSLPNPADYINFKSSFPLVLIGMVRSIDDVERQKLVLWIIDKIYALSTISRLTAEDCYKKGMPDGGFVIDIAKNECVPCVEEPKLYTLDGKECVEVMWAEKCFESGMIMNAATPVIDYRNNTWDGAKWSLKCMPCGEGKKTEDGITCVPVSTDGKKKPKSVCGNGKKEGKEQCDDGNKVNGDGCDSKCKIEVPSGPKVGKSNPWLTKTK